MNMISHKSLISLISASLLMLSAAIAQAATLYVPSQYSRLQTAINAAHAGDTIIVAAGNYNDYSMYPPTVWSGKDLTIKGAGAGKTLFLSNGTASCLTVNNLTSASSIQGFTFENGWQSGGGGINATNSNLTVNSCEFSYNQAAFGAGMCNIGGNPTISNCTFHHNVAAACGGAIFNQQSSPTVTDCVFDTNSAPESGGGISNQMNCNPKVTNCVFSNQAGYDGGGIDNEQSSNPTVTNCVFFNNMAYHNGGGIYNDFSSNSTVINCTFTQNSASSNFVGFGGGFGGGICSVTTQGYGPNSATVTNCILWGNTAAAGGPGIYGPGSVSHSDVQGLPNSTPDVNGNFDANPLFVSAASDNLRLNPGSPCINRGNDAVVLAPPFLTANGTIIDLDGNPRTVHGAVDLGAYELQPPTDVTGQFSIIMFPPSAGKTAGTYQQAIMLINNGPKTVAGPIYMVLNGLAGYTLTNATGLTNVLAPAGRPYINTNDFVFNGTLPPGPPLVFVLQFTKTGAGTLSYSAQIVAGPGAL
jgi:parallel beta-helix repeat protein